MAWKEAHAHCTEVKVLCEYAQQLLTAICGDGPSAYADCRPSPLQPKPCWETSASMHLSLIWSESHDGGHSSYHTCSGVRGWRATRLEYVGFTSRH